MKGRNIGWNKYFQMIYYLSGKEKLQTNEFSKITGYVCIIIYLCI